MALLNATNPPGTAACYHSSWHFCTWQPHLLSMQFKWAMSHLLPATSWHLVRPCQVVPTKSVSSILPPTASVSVSVSVSRCLCHHSTNVSVGWNNIHRGIGAHGCSAYSIHHPIGIDVNTTFGIYCQAYHLHPAMLHFQYACYQVHPLITGGSGPDPYECGVIAKDNSSVYHLYRDKQQHWIQLLHFQIHPWWTTLHLHLWSNKCYPNYQPWSQHHHWFACHHALFSENDARAIITIKLESCPICLAAKLWSSQTEQR
jgi:hypothetical protein